MLSFIFASALTLALYDLCKKHSVHANRVFPVLFLTTGTGFLAVTLSLAATGKLGECVRLSFASENFPFLALKSAIVALSWTFAYLALRTMPVTVMAPIRATGPVWVFLGAVALFGEIPTAAQAAGFALAFAGCIMFSLATKREGYTFHSASLLFAIAGTLVGAASALYDKHIIGNLHLPPEIVLWCFMGGMGVIYLAATLATWRLDRARHPFKWRWTIPAVGILLAISDFCYFSAISSPGAKISILSVMRRTSVAITFIAGGAVFHETNLLRKGLALAAILAGVAILALAS